MKESKKPEVKMIIPFLCPHCKKEAAIQLKMTSPEIVGILTPVIITKAKETVIAGIVALRLEKEEEIKALKWINDPNTLFGPKDIEEILNNLSQEKDVTFEETDTK